MCFHVLPESNDAIKPCCARDTTSALPEPATSWNRRSCTSARFQLRPASLDAYRPMFEVMKRFESSILCKRRLPAEANGNSFASRRAAIGGVEQELLRNRPDILPVVRSLERLRRLMQQVVLRNGLPDLAFILRNQDAGAGRCIPRIVSEIHVVDLVRGKRRSLRLRRRLLHEHRRLLAVHNLRDLCRCRSFRHGFLVQARLNPL